MEYYYSWSYLIDQESFTIKKNLECYIQNLITWGAHDTSALSCWIDIIGRELKSQMSKQPLTRLWFQKNHIITFLMQILYITKFNYKIENVLNKYDCIFSIEQHIQNSKKKKNNREGENNSYMRKRLGYEWELEMRNFRWNIDHYNISCMD